MRLISKSLTTALAIAGAAIVLAPTALAATSGSAAPQHMAVTAPACGNAHPALPGGAFVWATLPGDGFAGGIGYVMEITNTGHRACSLRGVPGAAIQGSSGHLIGSKVPASGKGPLITLKPGATAHPVGGQVLIYLPGQQQAQDGWLDAQACPSVCFPVWPGMQALSLNARAYACAYAYCV
jgi:hypothetical protein